MNTTIRPSKETYIWDEGYAYPTEQERVMTFVSSCIESVAIALKGRMSAEAALVELSKHQPNNQICILSQSVVDKYLQFVESQTI